jgi:periplasmic nitrate reductase NapD
MTGVIHIAGMLVHAREDAMDEAVQAVARFGNAQIHSTGVAGKFVVVLECTHEREIADCIEHAQAVPGVVSVSMTSHFVEDAAALGAEMPE